jgi:hypothetical protein
MADRMRRSLPTRMSGHLALDRITVGLMAIGRKVTGAISGWLDRGRDDRINSIRVAGIGIAMVIVASDPADEIGITTVTVASGPVIANGIVAIDSEAAS